MFICEECQIWQLFSTCFQFCACFSRRHKEASAATTRHADAAYLDLLAGTPVSPAVDNCIFSHHQTCNASVIPRDVLGPRVRRLPVFGGRWGPRGCPCCSSPGRRLGRGKQDHDLPHAGKVRKKNVWGGGGGTLRGPQGGLVSG